jgi:hypothetical protein
MAISTTKTVMTVDDDAGAVHCTTSGRRTRTITGALLVTAATTAASLLGTGAPANAAADDFIAISAVGGNPNIHPIFTIGGVAVASNPDKATNASVFNCISNGGGDCAVKVIAQNSCVAVAANDFGETGSAVDIWLTNAADSARHKLQNQQGVYIVAEGCSDGAGIFVAPIPPPKLGPTVSFKPVLGGLEADIVDRSGISSQCTYAMDDVNRSFALAANSTFDLRIVPAIPRFRDRNVTITCDNGTKTQARTRF